MSHSKRTKPHVVEAHGVKVRLYKEDGRYYLDVRHGTKRVRTAARTADKGAAEEAAKALAREIATQQLLGVTPDTLTLGQLFAAYHTNKGATLEGQWKRAIERRKRDFITAWGDGMPVAAISQSSVDTYCVARRTAYIERQRDAYAEHQRKLAARAAERGKPVPIAPPLVIRPLRDGALDPDFRWLSSAFNWALRHKLTDGKRLLSYNPLHDCKWPKEQKDNIRRPVASQERYERTIAVANQVDSLGRFRLAPVLARYTARRIDAILHLRSSDVLRSKERIRAALAEAGQDERRADRMTHGAIRWRREYDKQGVERITPISDLVRAELDRYLADSARVGESWLFPADADPKEGEEPQPLSRSTATNWIMKAERLAGVPKLRGGLWHAYRRLWATERKTLPDVDVAEAGGWTGTKAMKLSYQQHTDDGVLAAVLN